MGSSTSRTLTSATTATAPWPLMYRPTFRNLSTPKAWTGSGRAHQLACLMLRSTWTQRAAWIYALATQRMATEIRLLMKKVLSIKYKIFYFFCNKMQCTKITVLLFCCGLIPLEIDHPNYLTDLNSRK